ncbi:MAG: GNAT family N-acetyltransferase, partial [Betaproteobacteria bacterium]
MSDDYRIATMTRAEVDLAIDWAAHEGWNPGLDDAASFHAADPEGFLLGRLGNVPVATISVVRYGATSGFLGLYVVRSDHRGHGYGKRIWDVGLARLAGRNVGLDGVVAQQDNYRKSGF